MRIRHIGAGERTRGPEAITDEKPAAEQSMRREKCFALIKPCLCSVVEVAASIRTKIMNAAEAASSKNDQVIHRECVCKRAYRITFSLSKTTG